MYFITSAQGFCSEFDTRLKADRATLQWIYIQRADDIEERRHMRRWRTLAKADIYTRLHFHVYSVLPSIKRWYSQFEAYQSCPSSLWITSLLKRSCWCCLCRSSSLRSSRNLATSSGRHCERGEFQIYAAVWKSKGLHKRCLPLEKVSILPAMYPPYFGLALSHQNQDKE